MCGSSCRTTFNNEQVEAGVVLVAANNVAQARIAYNYISAVFDEAPALRAFVTRRTSDTIELGRLRTAIRVLPANAISSRGHSFIGVILDEFAFFESREDLQNTDTEFVRALTPALLTTRGPLIMISSPWCAEGEFWKACTNG